MYFSRVIVVFFLLGLSACTRTTVHLHAGELPQTLQDGVKAGLESEGFKVSPRANAYPYDESVVLYFPHEGIDADLQAIDKVLTSHGLSAENRYTLYRDKIGKHVYTAGNIGLYLLPENAKASFNEESRVRDEFPISESDAEFISTDCDIEYVYELFDDGRALVSDFSFPVGESTLARGTWQASENSVTLISDGEDFRYRKRTFHREYANQFSDHNISYHIILEPEDYYRLPFGCSYKSTFSEAF
ncbi:hypothetical protein [Gilvimarinus algae]|uniref:Uncharacterized protein n=1 Tax=Gilvimarinus algae TaxID=3058037 RepID=A0ABT8TEU3_9GAMM|nr:hypothetical protein [Gilvimarinus sp. SDUM040014]MDO3382461.1 hypothetical protein [Gilvimarinus sp. SDUM040014]